MILIDLTQVFFFELQDGHYIKPSKMDSGYRTIKKRKFQQTFGLKTDVRLDEISKNLTFSPYFSVGNRGAQTGASLSYLYMPAEKYNNKSFNKYKIPF